MDTHHLINKQKLNVFLAKKNEFEKNEEPVKKKECLQLIPKASLQIYTSACPAHQRLLVLLSRVSESRAGYGSK